MTLLNQELRLSFLLVLLFFNGFLFSQNDSIEFFESGMHAFFVKDSCTSINPGVVDDTTFYCYEAFSSKATFTGPHRFDARDVLLGTNGEVIWGLYGSLAFQHGDIWNVYNLDNSDLPSSNILSMEYSPQGDLYLGTSYGLVKFENGTVQEWWNTWNSGIVDNTIREILFAQNGDIWVTTDGGVSRFDGTTWTAWDENNSTIPDDNVYDIFQFESGEIVIGCAYDPMYAFDGNNWVIYEQVNGQETISNVRDVLRASDSTLYIAGFGRGLTRIKGDSVFTWDHDNTDSISWNVESLAEGPDGRIYIGTWGGIVVLNEDDWTIYNTENSPLPHNEVNELMVDEMGVLYFCTEGGVGSFDGTDWIIYKEYNNGFLYDYIEDITFDAQGDLLIGTYGGGIQKYDGEHWTLYNEETSIDQNDQISDFVTMSNGDILAGTNRGITKYDGNNWEAYRPEDFGTSAKSLTLDENEDLYFVTTSTIIKFEEDTVIRWSYQNSDLPRGVYDIHLALNGDFYAATAEGLFMFENETWVKFDTTDAEAPGYVGSIFETPNGDLYFSSTNGLYRYNDLGWKLYEVQTSGLSSANIQTIYHSSNDTIYLGVLGQPVQKIVGDSIISIQVTHSDRTNRYVSKFLELENGDVAIGTSFGLVINKTLLNKSDVITGITTNSSSLQKVAVIPNPVKTLAKIELPQYSGETTIEIFDQAGRLKYSSTHLATQEVFIDGSSLSSGIYFGKAYTPETEDNIHFKFLVE